MNNKLLSRAPFSRITLLFATGIVLALFFNMDYKLATYIFVAFFVFSTIIYRLLFRRFFYLKVLFGISISVTLIFAGYTITNYKLFKTTNINDIDAVFLGKVISKAEYKNKKYKVKLHIVQKIDSLKRKQALDFDAIAYLKTDTDTLKIETGDYLIIKTYFKNQDAPKNPYQFNYKNYLIYAGISKIGFAKENEWKLLKNKSFNIFRLSEQTREYLLNRFKLFNFKKENFAIISALVLGDRSNLSNELSNEFANAGVMHILAVSGLHVGVLFLILSLIFKNVAGYKLGRISRFITIIASLWIYAFITGLSPSVVRSVLMFSIVSLSILTQRDHNIYNTVLVSAFVLLWINPFYITQIGFQLSYLAVLGILFFQPKISKIIKIKNKIIRYFWDLTAVSIAAQISTAPLTLYYFGKFPNYFIITNLAVMFLVAVLLSLGIAFIFISYIKYINEIIAKIIDFLLDILRYIINKVNGFPYNITDYINITAVEALLLYVVILSFAYHITYRNKKSINILITSILLFFIAYNFNVFDKYPKNEIAFFSVNRSNYIGIKNQNKAYLLSSKMINSLDLSKDFDFHLKKYFIRNNLKNVKIITIDTNKFETGSFLLKNNFIKINKTIIQFYDKNKFDVIKPNIDILYIVNFEKNMYDKIIQTKPRKVIISNTVPFYKQKKISNFLESNKIKFKLLSKKSLLLLY